MLGTHSSVENIELGLFANHAHNCLGIRNPDCRVLIGGLLATLLDQIFDALVDVSHPFLVGTRKGKSFSLGSV